MPTLTTNYEFQLPVEGADDDVWGGFLNANWAALDTRLFSGTIGADTTGNAATATLADEATLAADATKLATARTLTIGDTGKTFDGSANVTWTLGEVGVTLASQVEAEAGTDNTKFMTPLRTAEAIAELSPAPPPLSQAQATDAASTVFGQVSGQRLAQAAAANAPAAYESAPIVPTTSVTVSHGLGAVPSSHQVVVRCVTPQFGYSIGDEIDITGINDASGVRLGTTFCNATQIGRRSTDTNLRVMNKSNGSQVTINLSTNWRYVFRARL